MGWGVPGALASFVLAACTGAGPKPAQPPSATATPTDSQVARPGAVADPARASPAPQPATSPETPPDPPSSSSDPPEGDRGARPTKREAHAATRARLGGKLARLTPTRSLPDGTAIVVWSKVQGEYPCEVDVILVRLARGPEGRWSAQDTVTLFESSTPWLGQDEAPPLAVTLIIDDWDDDGDTEVLVRSREKIMCPGGGPNTVTTLRMLNTEPALAVALRTELHHSMEAQPSIRTKATVRHADLDTDGHRDVQIDYVTTSEGAAVRARNSWHFDAASDSWKPHALGTEAFACEW